MKKTQMISKINALFDDDALMDFDQGSHISRLRRCLDFIQDEDLSVKEISNFLSEIDKVLELFEHELSPSPFKDFLEGAEFQKSYDTGPQGELVEYYTMIYVDKYIGAASFQTIVGIEYTIEFNEEKLEYYDRPRIVDEVNDFPLILSIWHDSQMGVFYSPSPNLGYVRRFIIHNEDDFRYIGEYDRRDITFFIEDDSLDHRMKQMMISEEVYTDLLRNM